MFLPHTPSTNLHTWTYPAHRKLTYYTSSLDTHKVRRFMLLHCFLRHLATLTVGKIHLSSHLSYIPLLIVRLRTQPLYVLTLLSAPPCLSFLASLSAVNVTRK